MKHGLVDNEIYNKILEKRPKDWDYEFANEVYAEVEKQKYFITNLGKCTQVDARPLPDEVLKQYLYLLEKEIEIINPKAVVLFGNQVSSIVLNKKLINVHFNCSFISLFIIANLIFLKSLLMFTYFIVNVFSSEFFTNVTDEFRHTTGRIAYPPA